MWARERLPLPLNYLIEPQLADELRFALSLADDVSAALRESIRALAKLLAAPLSDDRNARQPDPNDVRNIANSFSAHEFYWPGWISHSKSCLRIYRKTFSTNQVTLHSRAMKQ
jgi:hypothetical protein